MTYKAALLPAALLLSACIAPCETVTLPNATPLALKIDDHLPMRVGQPIRARLIYPVFADNQLVLPAGTVVSGAIVALRADHHRRVRARFYGDFTPFRIPVVRFTGITLPSGTELDLATGTATDGAPIFRITPPEPRKGSFLSRQFSALGQVAKNDVALFTAPGLGDRFTQLVYSQLPYHPQRIEKDTAWTVETSQPIELAAPAPTSETQPAGVAEISPTPSVDPNPTWLLKAYLSKPLDSATTKQGEQVRAIVAEPVFNADHTLAVPQGATLVGTVSRAKSARSFGRAGVLRFDFQQIVLPDGHTSNVQAALKGMDSDSDQLLDAEGEAKPKPQDKLIVPLLLSVLAARPLHSNGRHQHLREGVASNGGGFIGRIIGTAAGSPNLAAGIGYYQVAVSTWNRWIAKGKQVTFAQDTRVEIQTTIRRSTPLRGASTPPTL